MAQGGAEAVLRALMSSDEYRSHQVDELFLQFLNRHADPDGLRGFVAALDAGATLDSVRSSIAGSEEYYRDHGGTSDGFLEALYGNPNALNREIDSNGREFFGAQLSAGVSRSAVAEGLFHSAEGLSAVVQGLYHHLLHRDADAAGLAGFTAALSHGASEGQVIDALVGSPEFAARS
jgi:hypothetical protein